MFLEVPWSTATASNVYKLNLTDAQCKHAFFRARKVVQPEETATVSNVYGSTDATKCLDLVHEKWTKMVDEQRCQMFMAQQMPSPSLT